jgi:outer membrane protein assembly factor BamB
VWGRDGHFYVAAPIAGKVLRFDGRTGAFIDAFISNQDGRPAVGSGLAFGPDGHLYVGGDDAVSRYDARTGEFIDVFVQPGSGGLSDPVGMLFGSDGHLYVASAASGSVLRYDGKTGAFIDPFIPAGRGGLSGPRMIAFKLWMTVCHAVAGRFGTGRTLSVSQLDAADHVAHGDRLGACR